MKLLKAIGLIASIFMIYISYCLFSVGVFSYYKQPPSKDKILYLHIGLPKTGTSALQVFFAQNRDKLLNRGINYPVYHDELAKSGKISGGNGIMIAQYIGLFGNSVTRKIMNLVTEYDIRKELNKKHNILYSTELFTGSLSFFVDEVDITKKLMKLKKLCDQYGYRIKVICGYRSVAEFSYSYYSQIVKREFYTKNFSSFLRDDFDFRKVIKGIDNWIVAVGKDNFYLVDYDKNKHNLPKALFEKMNTDITTVLNHYNVRKSVNRSLSPSEILICSEFNKHFEQKGANQLTYFSDTLIYNLAKSNEIKSIIKQSDIDFIVKKYAAPVAQFNKKYGTDIKLFQENTVISDENVDNELSHEIKALVCIMADQVKRIKKLEKN